MNTSEKIREAARKAGLCDEHYKSWDINWSISDMVDYFMRNPNWCMQTRFPSIDMFKKYGDGNELCKKGVFVDMAVTTRAVLSNYIFLKCFVGVICDNVCSMYFRDGCKAKIIVDSGGIAMLDIYDGSEIDVETRGTGRVIVNQFGDVKPVMKGNNIKYHKR